MVVEEVEKRDTGTAPRTNYLAVVVAVDDGVVVVVGDLSC